MTSSKPLVLLTGANGFVGAHVLEHLLNANYRVRSTVRSLEKTHFIEKKYANHKEDLSFVIVPDIQAEGSLDEAVKDCAFICHVASPYFTSTHDPLKELLEPAVNGTKNVISSALKADGLERLTILSSFASVVDLQKNPRPGYVYTEEDWNPVTWEKGQQDGNLGYFASKTFAEKVAWDMYKKNNPSWDLVTFCPPMIYGPPLHEVHPEKGIAGLNTSLLRLLTGITGKDPAFEGKVSTFGLPAWVDVRNVAEAHVAALSLPKGTSERFLLCGGIDNFEDGLAGLRARGETGLGGEGEKIDRAKHYSLNSSKAEEMLKIHFTPFQKTVEDTWAKAKELKLV